MSISALSDAARSGYIVMNV